MEPNGTVTVKSPLSKTNFNKINNQGISEFDLVMLVAMSFIVLVILVWYCASQHTAKPPRRSVRRATKKTVHNWNNGKSELDVSRSTGTWPHSQKSSLSLL